MLDASPVQERTLCRNPRCRERLPVPTENQHLAFCSIGCRTSFYFRRCVVCEARVSPKAKTCGRRCSAEMRRNRAKYTAPLPTYVGRKADARSAHQMGLKIGVEGRPRIAVVAGSAEGLHPLNFQPLDADIADRFRRINRAYWRAASAVPDGPVDLVGSAGSARRQLDSGLRRKIIEAELPRLSDLKRGIT